MKAEDGGVYVCELTNGIGAPQRARARLAVECKYFRTFLLNTLDNCVFHISLPPCFMQAVQLIYNLYVLYFFAFRK